MATNHRESTEEVNPLVVEFNILHASIDHKNGDIFALHDTPDLTGIVPLENLGSFVLCKNHNIHKYCDIYRLVL